MAYGKVYLVGAGPGDVELLTLKAVRAIGQAHVLLIDDLVNREVLQFARKGARVVEVGKRRCESARSRDTLAVKPARGSEGQARFPQTAGFAGAQSTGRSQSDPEREMGPGCTPRELVPSALTCACTQSARRPGDTLAARPAGGSEGQARFPQTAGFAGNESARRCRSTSQDFIERLMIAEAHAGRTVARVKGGDPFVFGRGGEEMQRLRAARIEVEVVAGITSGIAAPGALGIPVTHRHYARGVTLVTGHTRNGEEPNWQALAHSGTTLVIYMGVARLPAITAALLEAGMPPRTAAAAVQHATLPQQRSVVSTLHALPQVVARTGIASPAIVVIGEVVKLAALAENVTQSKTTLAL